MSERTKREHLRLPLPQPLHLFFLRAQRNALCQRHRNAQPTEQTGNIDQSGMFENRISLAIQTDLLDECTGRAKGGCDKLLDGLRI